MSGTQRVAVLWKGWQSYIEGSIKALSELPDVEVLVLATNRHRENSPHKLENSGRARWVLDVDKQTAVRELDEFEPTLLLICGWDTAWFVSIGRRYRSKAPRILYFDNQWSSRPKQWLGILGAPLLLWPAFDFAFVPGMRQLEFASRLGYGRDRCGDGACCAATASISEGNRTRRGFVFVGRLVDEKGVECLARAYARYRRRFGEAAWPLTVFGEGPCSQSLADAGATLAGFASSQDLLGRLAEFDCLLLPSLFEPWGAVIHEAAAAGLVLLASDAVGAADRFLRHGQNGRIHSAGDEFELGRDLDWVSRLSAEELELAQSLSRELGARLTESDWAKALLAFADRSIHLPHCRYWMRAGSATLRL